MSGRSWLAAGGPWADSMCVPSRGAQAQRSSGGDAAAQQQQQLLMQQQAQQQRRQQLQARQQELEQQQQLLREQREQFQALKLEGKAAPAQPREADSMPKKRSNKKKGGKKKAGAHMRPRAPRSPPVQGYAARARRNMPGFAVRVRTPSATVRLSLANLTPHALQRRSSPQQRALAAGSSPLSISSILRRRQQARAAQHLWLYTSGTDEHGVNGCGSPTTPTTADHPVRQLIHMAAATAAAANPPPSSTESTPAGVVAARQHAASLAAAQRARQAAQPTHAGSERAAGKQAAGTTASNGGDLSAQLAARLPLPGTPVEVSELIQRTAAGGGAMRGGAPGRQGSAGSGSRMQVRCAPRS